MATPRAADMHVLRVGRLLAADGYAVRSGVQLAPGIGQRTEAVDLVAVAYGPRLEREVTVVTCVAPGRAAPSLADRVLWTAGARRLLGAQHAAVASARSIDQAAEILASRLQIELMGPADLDRRAAEAGSLDPRWTSVDSGTWQIAQRAQKGAQRHPELAPIGNWATSDEWLKEPVATVKRSVAALRRLQDGWSQTLNDERSLTVRWLAHQAIWFLAFAVVDLAARRLRSSPATFEKRLLDELSEGLASVQTLRTLSRHVDAYVMGALTQSGMAPAQAAERLGVLEPEPPGYADQLVEVIERFATRRQAARDVPALVAQRISEAQAASAAPPAYEPTGAHSPSIIGQDTGPLIRLVASFLRGQVGLEPALMEPLANRRREQSLQDTASSPSDEPPTVRRAGERGVARLETEVVTDHPEETKSSGPGTQTQLDTRPQAAAASRRPPSGSMLVVDESGHDLRPDGRGTTGRLTIGVRNLGNAPRRVVQATAKLGDARPVEARESVLIGVGARELLSFDVDAASIQPDGDRITVDIVDDIGHEYRAALRYTDTGAVRSD